MGRSPVFRTERRSFRLPALISTGSAASSHSPGITDAISFAWLFEELVSTLHLWDGVRDGDELCAGAEGGLDLDQIDHLGDALHAVLAAYDLLAELHHLGDRLTVSRRLEQRLAGQRD